MPRPRVALIGLGLMGSGMARRLLGAGFPCSSSPARSVSIGVEELAGEAAERGCALLDAPVTGSKVHAASGELSFLVGGSAAALETARPVLAAMSGAVVHVGATGRGALLKLINNFLAGVQAAALAEAIALKLMAKDLTYALGEGRRHGFSLDRRLRARDLQAGDGRRPRRGRLLGHRRGAAGGGAGSDATGSC
jgi:3-hydroxyisobutyrate dehydrogenase-like beta-hydroxyacid dehydrogenase